MRSVWVSGALVALVLSIAQVLASPSDSEEMQREIDRLEAQLDLALAERDRSKLDKLIAKPFTWIHSAGIIDSREEWLDQAAKGRAFLRQRAELEELDASVTAFSNDTLLRTGRLRFRSKDGKLETWMIQTRLYIKQDNVWKLAAGQGARLYEGPPVRAELYSRYAGRFQIEPGQELLVQWDGTSLIATFPNGNRYQIFLGSPTEEVTTAASKLKFVLDSSGNPAQAILTSGEGELWRAARQ